MGLKYVVAWFTRTVTHTRCIHNACSKAARLSEETKSLCCCIPWCGLISVEGNQQGEVDNRLVKDCQKKACKTVGNCFKFTSRATYLSHFSKYTLPTMSAKRIKHSFVPSVMRLRIEHNRVLPAPFLYEQQPNSALLSAFVVFQHLTNVQSLDSQTEIQCVHAPNQTPVFINAFSLQLPSYHFHKIKSQRR